MYDFFVVVVAFLLFCPKTHYFNIVTTFCNIFCNVNLFSILKILLDLWPIMRYKNTDLASLCK